MTLPIHTDQAPPAPAPDCALPTSTTKVSQSSRAASADQDDAPCCVGIDEPAAGRDQAWGRVWTVGVDANRIKFRTACCEGIDEPGVGWVHSPGCTVGVDFASGEDFIGDTVQVVDGQSNADCGQGGSVWSALCVSRPDPVSGIASWVSFNIRARPSTRRIKAGAGSG
jgi:hypothetical protein